MADIVLPPDPTLDEMRAALGAAIPAHAVFDGWRDTALENAARAIGIDPGHARLAFPDGVTGMIEAWYASIDARLAAAFPPERVAAMKFRDRISELVLARLALARPEKQAARSALAILAQPRNAATAAKLGWHAADLMWRLAGDTATDLNHYTKRLTLSAVYGSTLMVWLDDESEGEADTRAFLARRIEGVMRFEKFKAQIIPHPERRFSMSRFLGRLRYPAH
ncbi:COQ9 family protein [Sphingomonas oligoaromativorans]|uniref:COQ9 family protein n=1 Tax=Sphingomonas oligoaromativorans TaxID=575322 RepID=UPI001422F0E9|nr:COQ9 family protein [Sphingomonas oligoaromativorans]NIJ32933.1 ubiquinone biosynthesis protein COQ9 [Sphingomonas oligoaromativorans]